MKSWTYNTIFFLFLFRVDNSVADFGDTADPYFPQCPAFVTCPLLCVSDAMLCPVSCPSGQTLCNDGSCAEYCDEELESPCEAACASVACLKTDDYLPNCYDRFGSLYDAATKCAEGEEAEATSLYSFTEPGFIVYYAWMSAITFLILSWCAFNQRILPVQGSTMPLKEAMGVDDKEEVWSQTAYRNGIIGFGIYILTCVTFLGYQALLTLLTIYYYIQQGELEETLPQAKVVFEDEEQVLLAFIIVWMVGLFWHFALKWPYSVRSLFLRRCLFQDATHVAVFAPTKTVGDLPGGVSCTEKAAAAMMRVINVIMGFIYSDFSRGKTHGQTVFCKVRIEKGNRFFYFRQRRYTYNAEERLFVPGECSLSGTRIEEMNLGRVGLDSITARQKESDIGSNFIYLRKPFLLRTIYNEFTSVFYVYQTFIIWAWFPLYYYYMAIVYTIIVLTGGLSVSFFKYRNEVSLYKLATVYGFAEVLRDGQFVEVDHKHLVPGDVVKLNRGPVFADMVVLESSNLAVDESALTGESTPVSKASIGSGTLDGDVIYDPMVHKRQTISAGTTILESSNSEFDIGLVTSTGSFTRKGEMLRDILSYERHRFKFDSQVQIVLLILFIVAVITFVITGFVLIEDSWIYGWFYGIYVFASCLPALLPTVFVVSVGISDNRLSKQGVACVNSEAIMIAGKVRAAFFDKTGTLTKQGMDFLSCQTADELAGEKQEETATENKKELVEGMVSCHTLGKTSDGELMGNQVDKIMFESTRATLHGVDSKENVSITHSDGSNITILKRFDFDHHRMTQSVIARFEDGRVKAFVKGSAESIQRLCLTDTIPDNFNDVVRQAASEGIYQISMATKILPGSAANNNYNRDDIEKEVTFIGVINFKNVIREETPSVIKELKGGDIVCTMVTGDNVLTGVHIAKEAEMLTKPIIFGTSLNISGDIIWTDENNIETQLPEKLTQVELALTGEVWSYVLASDPNFAKSLVEHVRVFGRCTPQDKVSVVSTVSSKGYITLMCGDGGNDCGALKTAHVGIALSDAEASIVAPFTSLKKCLTSVPLVLKEGRCALASAFASYKYMIMYGQVETFNQMANAYFQITFAEMCWVFMDGLWMISMAFSLPLAQAAKTLAPERPTASVLGAHTMFSAVGVLAINIAFMALSLAILMRQPWYQCRKWDSNDVSNVITIGDNYEAEVLFLVTGYQYISSAIAFNFGYKFRASWIKNWRFVILVFIFTFIHFFSTLYPSKLSCLFRVNCVNENVVPTITEWTEHMPIQNKFNHTLLPVEFRVIIVILMVANTIATSGYEFFIVNGFGKRLVKKYFKNTGNDQKQSQDSADEIELIENPKSTRA